MSTTIFVVRCPDVPGAYRLVFKVPVTHPKFPGVVIGERERVLPWRQARATMDPEQYADVCRASFADWCARNPLRDEPDDA